MADLSLDAGGDLVLSATGDLATASGSRYTQQRLLRRLSSMPASYIWHLPYGGGLPAFVGRPTNAEAIEAVIREQLALEAGVSENPAPTITVDAEPNGQTYATIRYVDAATGQTETLSMPVGQ